MSSDILFASSNTHKYSEVRRILEPFHIPISHTNVRLTEIQAHSIERIAIHKAEQAYGITGSPILVEDDGLFIDSLGGFPGPYSSYVFETIGNRGILNLLDDSRQARFVAVVAYHNGHAPSVFTSAVPGHIATRMQGQGWGYDPIFIPQGAIGTFAQIEKDAFSHRARALRDFAQWYCSNY